MTRRKRRLCEPLLQIQQPGSDTVALLRENGMLQLARDDKVFFVPNRPIVGLSIVGLPGTRGQLIVVADSQILDKQLALKIDFQLSPCPPGFSPPVHVNRQVRQGNRSVVSNCITLW